MRCAHVTLLSSLLLATVTAACDHEYAKDDPRNPDAPRVYLTSPARGAVLGDVPVVAVTGRVVDADGDVDAVVVNGQTVPLATDGSFALTVPVDAGVTLLRATATDKGGHVGKQTQAVMAGALTPVHTTVRDALQTRISDQSFAAIARGTAGFIAEANLGELIAPLNPVVRSGDSDGTDCLYAQAFAGAVDVQTAQMSLVPEAGGLQTELILRGVTVPMHIVYAISCIDSESDVVATASEVRIRGKLRMGVRNGAFDIAFDNPDVTMQNLQLDMAGVPGRIVNMLALDRALGSVLGYAAEKFIVPSINQSLAGLTGTTDVMLLGKTVTIQVTPAAIDIDAAGAMVRLNSLFKVEGDEAGQGFVYTPNATLGLSNEAMALAVADDALNQLFGAAWASGLMNQDLDLTTGEYGSVGQLFNRIQTDGRLPLWVAAREGGLAITVGDLLARFTSDGTTVTAAAINGTVGVKVEAAATGELRLAVTAPEILVDVLDSADGVSGTNALSNAQFEALVSFGASRAVGLVTGALGTVPLPSFGGVSVRDVSVDGADGFVVVRGRLQ